MMGSDFIAQKFRNLRLYEIRIDHSIEILCVLSQIHKVLPGSTVHVTQLCSPFKISQISPEKWDVNSSQLTKEHLTPIPDFHLVISKTRRSRPSHTGSRPRDPAEFSPEHNGNDRLYHPQVPDNRPNHISSHFAESAADMHI